MADKTLQFAKYTATESHPKDVFDPEWLEETNLAGVLDPDILQRIVLEHPSAVRDLDKDGYLEIRADALVEAAKAAGKVGIGMPLATYFGDPTGKKPTDRLKGLPRGLEEAAKNHDFEKARDYFSRIKDSPLGKLAGPLAAYLKATARHSGVDLDDAVTLDNKSGFSVFRDGRLRFDCGMYPQLAGFVLDDIPNLRFTYVRLSRGLDSPGWRIGSINIKPSQSKRPIEGEKSPDGFEPGLNDHNPQAGHVVLIVSDDEGRNLIVSNHTVKFFEGYPLEEIRRRYSEKYTFYGTTESYGELQTAVLKRF